MPTPCPEFSYMAAGPGAPDKFVLVKNFNARWVGVPKWIWDIVARKPVRLDSGFIVAFMEDGVRVIHVRIFAGHYFAVSVAPSFERAKGPACLHDWIYANSAALAAAWGCPVRVVLHLGDHFFLALMRFTGFGLKRTYFCGVRVLGYGFNRLCNLFKKQSPEASANGSRKGEPMCSPSTQQGDQ